MIKIRMKNVQFLVRAEEILSQNIENDNNTELPLGLNYDLNTVNSEANQSNTVDSRLFEPPKGIRI